MDNASASDKAAISQQQREEHTHDGQEVGAALNAQLRDAMSEDSRPSGGPTADEKDDVHEDGEGTSSSHASTHSEDNDEEDDEEDEEPTLRYSRIQSQPLAELFSRGDTCSSLAVSDKYLVLGTHNGGVVILARPGQANATDNPAAATSGHARAESDKRASYISTAGESENVDNEEMEGQKVLKRYKPHQASVMAIVIDEDSQFVGTASTDGKVVILNVASSDAQLFDLGRPLRCLALEPSYASKSTRQFVSGGLSGNLTLHEKGWLGPKDVVLHSGEGPIWAVKWHKSYIAWANDKGVRVYDTHSSSRIAFIPKSDDSPRADLFPPTLLWQSDTKLVTAQADFVRIVHIRDRRQQERQRLESERAKAVAELEEKQKRKDKDSGSVKSDKTGHGSYNPLAGMGAYVPSIPIPGVSAVTGSNGTNQPPIYAEVTSVLQLDCMISGIVPFMADPPDSAATFQSSESYSSTPLFLVLSHTTDDSFADESTPVESKPSLAPELRIISITGGEELSSDVLSVQGYEKFGCKDYHLVAHYPNEPSGGPAASTSSTLAEAQSQPSTPRRTGSRIKQRGPLLKPKTESYFVISPRELLLVKKRDVADHIAWLCERNRFEEALSIIDRKGIITSIGPSERSAINVEDIGERFLQHLVDRGMWEKAAQNFGKILGQDAKKWENWIFTFIQKGHMHTVIPFVPTHNPQLDHMVYEMILAHFLKTDASTLLQTIKTWPADIYDAQAVTNALKSAYEQEVSSSRASGKIDTLMETLVTLHLMNKQPGKAVPYYLRLRKPGVFDLIRDNSLFTDIQDQALLLVEFDQDMRRRREKGKQRAGVAGHDGLEYSKHGEAIDLLIDHTHSIPVPRVVTQLKPNRQFLYMYLDALFTSDPATAFEYSDLLVELYAEFESTRLMDFLRASTAHSLEKAYSICRTKDYVPEMVFLLGRMGNNKQALELIIERLGDVQRAIDFAKEQNDHDLWEDLLKYSETRPAFIKGLLENVGPEIDPIRLIRRIKNGLQVPGLKPALIKILQDFNIQISLIEGCKTILNTDCRSLTIELHAGQTNAFVGSLDRSICFKCSKPAFLPPLPTSSTPASATPAEALSIIFLCRHIYHISCALPESDLPSRPQHFLNPLLDATSGLTERIDRDRDIAAKILFASQLKARSKAQVRCPACVAGKAKVQGGDAVAVA